MSLMTDSNVEALMTVEKAKAIEYWRWLNHKLQRERSELAMLVDQMEKKQKRDEEEMAKLRQQVRYWKKKAVSNYKWRKNDTELLTPYANSDDE